MNNLKLPILPTSMVGSYAMPGWLERLKTEYFARRISHHDLDEIYDAAAKAAIKDQEIAGLDMITDGEPRRDNMVDYFLERLPGVQIDRSSKKFYYDFYDSSVKGKLPTASLGLVKEFQFLSTFTDRPTKICITGPHSLTKRIRNEFYPRSAAHAHTLRVEPRPAASDRPPAGEAKPSARNEGRAQVRERGDAGSPEEHHAKTRKDQFRPDSIQG